MMCVIRISASSMTQAKLYVGVPSDFISTRSPTASGEKETSPWTRSFTTMARSGLFRKTAGFSLSPPPAERSPSAASSPF